MAHNKQTKTNKTKKDEESDTGRSRTKEVEKDKLEKSKMEKNKDKMNLGKEKGKEKGERSQRLQRARSAPDRNTQENDDTETSDSDSCVNTYTTKGNENEIDMRTESESEKEPEPEPYEEQKERKIAKGKRYLSGSDQEGTKPKKKSNIKNLDNEDIVPQQEITELSKTQQIVEELNELSKETHNPRFDNVISLIKGIIEHNQRLELENKKLAAENKTAKETADRLEKVEKAILLLQQQSTNTSRQINGQNQSYAQKASITVPKPSTQIVHKTQSTPTVIRTAKPNPKGKQQHIVTIYPKDQNKITSCEETRAVIIKNVNLVKENITVKNIRKISNNGILIETKTKQDLDKITKNAKLEKAGLTANEPPKKKPKIILYDLPRNITEDEITEAMWQQNPEIAEKIPRGEIKLVFRTGRKDKETVNWVAETTPNARNVLKKMRRIVVDFQMCSFRDYILAARCFKCQSYGHVSKHCLAKEDTCGHCAETGHSYERCPNKAKSPCCASCKRAGRNAEHSVKDKACPQLGNANTRITARTDYGA